MSAARTGTGDWSAPVTGVVTWFNADKGFGFIRPDKGGGGGSNSTADVFVHVRNIQNKEAPIEGEHVSYVLATNDRNQKTQAINVVLTDRARPNSGAIKDEHPPRYGD
jgi:CspA family cold shock protein